MSDTTVPAKLAEAGVEIGAAVQLMSIWQRMAFEEEQATPFLRVVEASGRAASVWAGCYSAHTHGSEEFADELARLAFATLVALATMDYDPVLSLADHARAVLENPTYGGLPGSRYEVDGEQR